MNYTTIPIIVVFCYIVIEAIKQTRISNKWFPLISCCLGAIFAAALYYIFPGFVQATGLMPVVVSGAISGLAATGTNQVFKQLLKSAEEGTLTITNGATGETSKTTTETNTDEKKTE